MCEFLEDLGHPEQSFPAIHIAGTSGKGSTAIMIAEVLRSAGYNVGLHMTPYLQIATEKLWYNGKYASAEEFIDLVEWIKPICEKWRSPETPLHGMASFGLCLEYFRRKKVDIAVIETGVGGRNDLTNVLNTTLSVITPIGIDHTKTLGETINEIAWHKAGIIKKGVPVVAYKGAGADVIEAEAGKMSSKLYWVEGMDSPVKPGNDKRALTDSLSSSAGLTRGSKTIMQGVFQATNAQIATKACEVLGVSNILNGMSSARLPGRFEILQENPRVIIDGAHNYQKLEAILKEFDPEKLLIIFGLLKSKVNKDVLRLLSEKSKNLILTNPKVYGKEPADPKEFDKDYEFIDSPKDALQEGAKRANTDTTILITGSLYLCGNIRELYYASEKVLENRMSWF